MLGKYWSDDMIHDNRQLKNILEIYALLSS